MLTFLAGHAARPREADDVGWGYGGYSAPRKQRDRRDPPGSGSVLGGSSLLRRTLVRAIARTWAMWVVVALWAFLYPIFRGGVLQDVTRGQPRVAQSFRAEAVAAVLSSCESRHLAPTGGRLASCRDARSAREAFPLLGLHLSGPAPTVVGLTAKLKLAPGPKTAESSELPNEARVARVRRVLGPLAVGFPALMPSLHWHSYYALFGSLGAWLVVARLLSWRPQAALAVVALLALLRAGRSGTVLMIGARSRTSGEAVQTLALMRSDLQTPKWPRPARHAGFYFP